MSGRVLIVSGRIARDAAGSAMPAALRRQGFLVTVCAADREVVRVLDDVDPCVVILEDAGGHGLIRLIRRHSRAAILLVTERGGDSRGADGCLRRPFAMVDLMTRVRTLARRRTRNAARQIPLGQFRISETGEAHYDQWAIPLTRTEQRVLALLVSHVGVAVSKPDLLAAVWGVQTAAPNVVEVNISTLRRKLEQHGPRIVRTVRGIGYRLGEPL